MLIPILQQIWLNENEAKIYLASLELWTIHAWRIIKQTWLARATVYDSLERLIKKWLISKYTKKGTTTFTAEDPEKLEDILELQSKSLSKIKESLNKVMPNLQKIKNLFLKLPSLKMFEWKEWINTVLNDWLTAKEVIYCLVNVDDMEKYIKDINDEFIKKRRQYNVYKKWLILNTPFAKELMKKYDRTVTEVRLLPKNTKLFHSELNIYDWKISYMAYRWKNQIGVIIENEDIYNIQRSIFDVLWEQSEIIK